MKKVLVISSSLRANSTSKTLALDMIKGLKENNNVELIDLNTINFSFCKGCLACQSSGKCIIDDDIKNIIDKVNDCDILVFASPVYYYSVSGQLKTFLDRMNPLYISQNRKFKEVYALFTCADDNVNAFDKPNVVISGWVECFDGVKFVDTFGANSVNSYLDITQDLKEKAYQFGRGIK